VASRGPKGGEPAPSLSRRHQAAGSQRDRYRRSWNVNGGPMLS